MKLYSYYCIEVTKETYVLCYQKVLKISFRLNLWGAGGKSAQSQVPERFPTYILQISGVMLSRSGDVRIKDVQTLMFFQLGLSHSPCHNHAGGNSHCRGQKPACQSIPGFRDPHGSKINAETVHHRLSAAHEDGSRQAQIGICAVFPENIQHQLWLQN